MYNVSSVFYDCYELERIDMSNFDFSKTEYASSLFEDCKRLTDINCTVNIHKSAKQDYIYRGTVRLENRDRIRRKNNG